MPAPMTCLRSLLALLVVWCAGGCGPTRRCTAGTLFVDATLDAPADQIVVHVTVDGDATITSYGVLDGKATHGTLEVTFPHGYPSGRWVTVEIVATAGTRVSSGSRRRLLGAGCDTLALDVGPLDGGS